MKDRAKKDEDETQNGTEISDWRPQYFRSQISDLRFQIPDLRFQISDHYCPVKSQIESVGYDCHMDYLDRQGSQIGLKWAFFQKATGSRLAK